MREIEKRKFHEGDAYIAVVGLIFYNELTQQKAEEIKYLLQDIFPFSMEGGYGIRLLEKYDLDPQFFGILDAENPGLEISFVMDLVGGESGEELCGLFTRTHYATRGIFLHYTNIDAGHELLHLNGAISSTGGVVFTKNTPVKTVVSLVAEKIKSRERQGRICRYTRDLGSVVQKESPQH